MQIFILVLFTHLFLTCSQSKGLIGPIKKIFLFLFASAKHLIDHQLLDEELLGKNIDEQKNEE